MNMYKRLLLSFKGLAAESGTCFRMTVGAFSAQPGVELFIIIIIMCWRGGLGWAGWGWGGTQHPELMTILKVKVA